MSGSERRISVVAEDTPEAFLRLTGLLARRGFRFREMSLGRTMRPGLARYTLVLPGDAGTAEQAIRQLRKVVDVLHVEDVTGDAFRERWVALIRCDLPVKDTALLHRLLDRTSLRVIGEGAGTMLLEASGDRETVDACVEAMSAFGVRDVLTGGPFIMGLSSGEGESN